MNNTIPSLPTKFNSPENSFFPTAQQIGVPQAVAQSSTLIADTVAVAKPSNKKAIIVVGVMAIICVALYLAYRAWLKKMNKQSLNKINTAPEDNFFSKYRNDAPVGFTQQQPVYSHQNYAPPNQQQWINQFQHHPQNQPHTHPQNQYQHQYFQQPQYQQQPIQQQPIQQQQPVYTAQQQTQYQQVHPHSIGQQQHVIQQAPMQQHAIQQATYTGQPMQQAPMQQAPMQQTIYSGQPQYQTVEGGEEEEEYEEVEEEVEEDEEEKAESE